MDKITRIGVDLAKNIIQVHGVDSMERVVVRKAISRQKFLEWFANLEPCLVAMEACSAAHYWGRKLRALGHEVRLIAPQFAAPYRKGGKHVKNDRLDAEAICEAAGRPHMRFVAVKTADQQNVLVLHRMRDGFVEERTALVNRLRGELVEFGVFLPQGIDAFRAHFVEALEDGATELNGVARTALLRGWEHLQALDQQIAWCDVQVATHVKQDSNAQRVMAVIGIGPLTARPRWPPSATLACSKTAANLPPGSARCPNRKAAAARPGWATSRSRATRICARCCSRARARP